MSYTYSGIAYDARHNLVRDRTRRNGFFIHFSHECSQYPRFSLQWKLCVCEKRVGHSLYKAAVMYLNGVDLDTIVRSLGIRDKSCVFAALAAYADGLPRKRLTMKLVRVVARLLRDGMSVDEVAELLRIPHRLAERAVKAARAVLEG